MIRMLRGWGRRVRARPLDALVRMLVVLAAFYAVAYPFFQVTYPPITDLPFHAAEASILRHYLEPSWHFKEQFTFHPLEAPYLSMYVVGAFFALFLPITWAVKAMCIVMLGMLPVGLAIFFKGMKKSPLWGLLGCGLVWNKLTHWGFINHMGAVGLYAAVIGCTLLVIDWPTFRRQVALAVVLCLVFFTHIWRFPFALLSCLGTVVLMWPATRRVWPVIPALVPSVLFFAIWRKVRRAALDPELGPLKIDKGRLKEIPDLLFDGWAGPDERVMMDEMLRVGLIVLAITAVIFILQGRFLGKRFRQWWWGFGVTVLPIFLAGGFLYSYLVLPMTLGTWWYVYPREIVTACFVVLAVAPDLPKQWWLKLPLLVPVAMAIGKVTLHNAEHYKQFENDNRDFPEIVALIPKAPKLMYLIFEHNGSQRTTTPYLHMPAWVQAQHGGWLSWHFVSWDQHPFRYRDVGGVVPPPRQFRWEWSPYLFDLRTDGPFFDTFLVRQYTSPDHLFAGDPKIKLVRHIGSWWLYRRTP